MALLPWEEWIYHLSEKRDEVQTLHTNAVTLLHMVNTEIGRFNHDLDTVKSLTANNAALVVIANAIGMSDLLFRDFTVEVDALVAPPQGVVPAQVGEMLSELVAGGLLVKAIANVGKLAKNFLTAAADAGEALGSESVGAITEVAAETGLEVAGEAGAELTAEAVGEGVAEAVAEAAIEGVSLGALAETGIGIFAAVGIDLIFGAINGAKERDELNAQIEKLRTALTKVRFFYNTVMGREATLSGHIVGEEQRFNGITRALGTLTGEAATFPTDLAATVANAPQFVAAAANALRQYAVYVQVRDRWALFTSRNPNATRSQFIDWFMLSAPKSLDAARVGRCWDFLKAYSQSIRAAAA